MISVVFHAVSIVGPEGCPQFTKEESVHVCEIIDQVDQQIAAQAK